ncbi:DUF6156 family protein [Methylocella sp.]|uniref:DUF6156 family protein n=1 Tax=Methylocella sp. TaxID=1978226 RepID=UPI0037848BFF
MTAADAPEEASSEETCRSEEAYRSEEACRYFVSYTGSKLPFRLVEPLDRAGLTNRNTFIRAWFDEAGRLLRFEKMVYGAVELVHVYDYDAAGVLRRAEIAMMDEDPVELLFDETGARAAERGGAKIA